MNLLDPPPDIPMADVSFHCETWEEFDKTVDWLIKNGAPLEWKGTLVRMKGKKPYAQGDLVNMVLGATFGYVYGEEARGQYTVYMPHDIRR